MLWGSAGTPRHSEGMAAALRSSVALGMVAPFGQRPVERVSGKSIALFGGPILALLAGFGMFYLGMPLGAAQTLSLIHISEPTRPY